MDQDGDNLISPSDEVAKLHVSMFPNNFTGPTQFKSLLGRCFDYTTEK